VKPWTRVAHEVWKEGIVLSLLREVEADELVVVILAVKKGIFEGV